MDSCANCLTKFNNEEEKVLRINCWKGRGGAGEGDHDGREGREGQHHIVQFHGQEETLELSVVTLQESGELEVTNLERLGQLGGVEDEVGGEHHFQVDVEEAQRLIDSGVGTVSIILEKKPFLQAYTLQDAQSIERLSREIEANQAQQEREGADGNKEAEGQREEGVLVLEALSNVFGIPLAEDLSNVDAIWSKNYPCALCHKCAEVVTILYSAFQDFKLLSVESSYVARGIKQCLRRVNEKMSNTKESFRKEDVLVDQTAKKRGRKPKGDKEPVIKKPKKLKPSRNEKLIKSEIHDDGEREFVGICGDVNMSSSSDSDSSSLSDLEIEINETEPRKTRVSTRPRVMKKPPSDYEELQTSEEEQEENFEDDEEEDPNFDAIEEIEDIKETQEHLRLKQLSDICSRAVEYKEEELEIDVDGKFICPECKKPFKGIRTLNKHVVVHNLKKSPKCPHCSDQFNSLEDLHRHIKSSHEVSKGKRYPGRPATRGNRFDSKVTTNPICVGCGKLFESKAALKEHGCEHQNSTSICDHCKKDYPTPAILKRHQRDVHFKKEIEMICPECGETFEQLDLLSAHFSENHQKILNFCRYCGKSFHKLRYLHQHIQETHLLAIPDEETMISGDDDNDLDDREEWATGIDDPLLEPGERQKKIDPTPFKCPHCEKEYKRKKQLDVHILFHNGEEPQHSCTHCSKRFFQARTLKRHLLLHSSNNVCELCDKVFPKEDQLERHLNTAHGSNKSQGGKKIKKDATSSGAGEHKCNDCDKTFTRKEYLRLHTRIHTGEKPFECDQCGKTFRDPRNLAQHLVTHKTDRPFCCSICGLTFKRAHHLNDHERTHREDVARPYICSVASCGKAFKLKKHLISHELVHSGTKDHQCEICGKAFNRKDNLRQHVNKVHGKESFSDLIRVPNELQLVQAQQVQTLVPVTAITNNGNNSATITTLQIPSQVFQTLPTHFTYTHL